MANIKSSKKRILVSASNTARNKAVRSRVRTSVRKVEGAVEAKDKESAREALSGAVAEISKAGSKGVYHRNTVARKISRLTKAVNAID